MEVPITADEILAYLREENSELRNQLMLRTLAQNKLMAELDKYKAALAERNAEPAMPSVGRSPAVSQMLEGQTPDPTV